MVSSSINHTIQARITAAPEVGAPVLVDFMEQPLHIRTDNPIELGRPDAAFDRSGMPVQGSRTVTIPVHIQGGGAAQVMRDVAQAVSVPDRWLLLKMQRDARPVWYRIRASSPGELDLSNVYREDSWWTWELRLNVDSTAVGERVAIPQYRTHETEATVENNSWARGVVLDTPGEAPTPLTIDVLPNMSMPGRRLLVSTFSVPWDSPLLVNNEPWLIRSDAGFTPGPNATRSGGVSFLSGGDGITMSIDSTGTRTFFTGNANAWKPEPGRYLLMARLYREGGSGSIRIRVGQRWFGQTSWQPWRTWRPTGGGNRSSWMPIGFLQHPFGDPGHGLSPADVAPSELAVQVQGDVSSSALLHFDQMAYVPVNLTRGTGERAMAAAHQPGVGPGPNLSWRVDGEHGRIVIRDAFGQQHSTPQPLRSGGWPVAVPGMATGVSMFLDTSDAPVGVDSVAVAFTMKVSASPRMLHLGSV